MLHIRQQQQPGALGGHGGQTQFLQPFHDSLDDDLVLVEFLGAAQQIAAQQRVLGRGVAARRGTSQRLGQQLAATLRKVAL